jgi:glycosyltransferase involved in cell wall biosynthesis
MMVASAPIVGYVDADGSTSAAEMRRLCEALGDADAIIATRWLPGSVVRVPQTRLRRFASRAFNALVRLFFGLRLTDTQCGAKVFRADSLRPLLEQLETADYAFDVDLLYLLARGRNRIVELPTVWEDRSGSHLELMRGSSLMLASLLRLRMRHSPLHPIVPLLDRVVPTNPLRMRDRLRILILNWRDIRHPQAGGAERYLHEIARRLVAAGQSVSWLTSSFEGAPRNETLDGISITRVGNAFTVYAAVPFEYLRSCVDQYDLVIDSENGIPFFSPLYSLKPKLCVVYHVHRDVFLTQVRPPLSWLLAWLETRAMPLVYRSVPFITISGDTRAAIHRLRLTERPVFVVQSGVDPALQPGTKARRPTVVYVGRLKPYKRIHLLLEAFARVRRSVPDAVLRIAGRGPDERRLRDLVRRLELDDAVIFEGFVDEARKRELLQEAWLFATASLIEGWGISVIEANACGTPAVSFDVPGLREAIVDGRSGVIVSSDGDLAEAIAGLLLDPVRRDVLSRGAIERVSGLSWETAASSMLDAISKQFVEVDRGVLLREGVWRVPGGGIAPAPHTEVRAGGS